MSRWIDRCCTGIEALIAAALAVMVVLVFGNVVLRYGFNSGITVSEEVSRWLFIWMTFLGAVVALKEHGHLGVDMVVQKLPPIGKKICLAVGHVVMLYIVWLLFQGSVAQARINWDVTAPVTGASMAIVYASGVVFSVLAGLILALDLLRLLTGRIAESEHDHLRLHPRCWGPWPSACPSRSRCSFCGVALMVHLGSFDTQILAQNMLEGVNNYPLMAVPFFMLAGELMNAGGLSSRIVKVADAMVGHVRGGLGYVAIIAATVVASISGSAVADTAAVAALLIPMMRNAGYNVPRAAGLIAAGGIIAPVIPPSIAIVVFGVVAQVSITKLFLAGLFPGIMMALTLTATWWLCAKKEKNVAVRRFSGAALGRACSTASGRWCCRS
jgi:TRAP-type C4-dicarboxylate transport system permease small subunit